MSDTGQTHAAPAVETARHPHVRGVDFARSGPWFAAFLLLALIAFWPTYLSRIGASTAYTHLHAVTAVLWMMMLVAQPAAIRARRLGLHRGLGKISFGLVPLIVLSVVLLSHSRLSGLTGPAFAVQSYVLYLQVSLVALFTLCYAGAMVYRRNRAVHARFMVCTALTLVDPVVVRLLLWVDSPPTWDYQLFTFGLTDLLLVGLIWLDRGSRRGRWVFLAMLPVFVVSQLPALLGLTASAPWQAFARWFAGLPLT